MKKLIQLPNGQWIDPERISTVRTILEGQGVGYVVVTSYEGTELTLKQMTAAQALAHRDELAEEINKLRD